MGEVYRARDTRIGREIAIKILPAEVEEDPERRRRFREEAVAAGALNHINVLTVHDVGVDDGRPYLVTELLHGHTLREILRRGPLTEDTAVSYAAGALDGLSAAHVLGITHRDLKPENIFITDDGTPKILDFGIAKLPAGWRWTDGTAVTSPAIDEGLLLGTVGYMAPEQVTGGDVDPRADLFSMAVVLHEMVSGTLPFARATAIEALNAIVTADPAPPDRAGVPLRAILRRGLQKSPSRRFQSASDFGFALRLARAPGGPPPARPVRSRIVPVLAALSLVLLIALAGVAAKLWRVARTPAATVHDQRVTFQQGKIWSARFMPGGDTIVYSASWDGKANRTYSARADFPAPIDLGLPPSNVTGVSPAGELALIIGKRSLLGTEPTAGTLARAALAGSAPRELQENVTAADWMPDGARLAVVRDLGRVRRLELPFGHPVYETAGWIGEVRVSRDGKRVAFADHPLRTDDFGDFVIVDDQGHLSRVMQEVVSASGLAWGPDDRELWVSADGRITALTAGGARRTIMQDPRAFKLLDVGHDGRMLVVSDERRVGLRGMLAGDAQERDFTWFDYSVVTDLAPNGAALLFFEASQFAPANYLIGLRRAGDPGPVRIGEGHPTSLSADGRWALATNISERSGLVMLPTGPGESRGIATPGLTDIHWATWLPDGQHIVLSAHERNRGARLYLIDLTGRILRPIGPEGTEYVWNGVSPDGVTIAAVDPDRRVTLYPLDGGAPAVVTGALPDERPAGWSMDGTELFVQSPGIPAQVWRVTVRTGQRTEWRELLPEDPTGVVRISPVLVAPGGNAYAYSYGRFLSKLYVISGVR